MQQQLHKYKHLMILTKAFYEYNTEMEVQNYSAAHNLLQQDRFCSFLTSFTYDSEELKQAISKLDKDNTLAHRIMYDLEELLDDSDYLIVFATLLFNFCNSVSIDLAIPKKVSDLNNTYSESYKWARLWFETIYYDFFKNYRGFRRESLKVFKVGS